MKQILTAAFLVLAGCSQIDKISPDQLEAGAKAVVKYGLAAAVRKFPAEAAKISADAKVADQVIAQNILPVFSGAATDTVLRSAVDQALAQLKGKITDARVSAAISLGTEIIIAEIQLPTNPADKLDERTKELLVSIFSGISQGIKAAFPPPTEPSTTGAPPPPAPSPVPPK